MRTSLLLSAAKPVTACAAVWIEIFMYICFPPSNLVTACAAVWIEIVKIAPLYSSSRVTACAAVWIEIGSIPSFAAFSLSHRLCGGVD